MTSLHALWAVTNLALQLLSAEAEILLPNQLCPFVHHWRLANPTGDLFKELFPEYEKAAANNSPERVTLRLDGCNFGMIDEQTEEMFEAVIVNQFVIMVNKHPDRLILSDEQKEDINVCWLRKAKDLSPEDALVHGYLSLLLPHMGEMDGLHTNIFGIDVGIQGVMFITSMIGLTGVLILSGIMIIFCVHDYICLHHSDMMEKMARKDKKNALNVVKKSLTKKLLGVSQSNGSILRQRKSSSSEKPKSDDVD